MIEKWLDRSKKVILFAIVATFFMSFSSKTKNKIVLNGFAQGTTWQIIYYSSNSTIHKHQVDSILLVIDQSMSLYKPGSLINKFNSSTRGIEIDNHLKNVLKKSIEINKKTKGAFDITVKSLVQAWGFGINKNKESPNQKHIDSLLACIGADKIILKGDSLLKTKNCVEIDLNGIAQGYSVDVIALFLEENGISDYLVELGGELRVKGEKSDGELFKVGIESPDNNMTAFKKVIAIESGAITTSGNYRNFKIAGDKKLSHLIDTKSGYPIANEMISVSVWAKDAITADGYDNAFMSMGLKKSIAFINTQKDTEAYFIYFDKYGNVSNCATKGFNKLFKQKSE